MLAFFAFPLHSASCFTSLGPRSSSIFPFRRPTSCRRAGGRYRELLALVPQSDGHPALASMHPPLCKWKDLVCEVLEVTYLTFCRSGLSKTSTLCIRLKWNTCLALAGSYFPNTFWSKCGGCWNRVCFSSGGFSSLWGNCTPKLR